MNSTLFKEHLDLISSLTGIGLLLTNGGRDTASSIYRGLSNKDNFKKTCSTKTETILLSNEATVTYTILYNNLSMQRIYQFHIGSSEGTEYHVETDIVLERAFEKYKDFILKSLLLLVKTFDLNEKYEQLYYKEVTTDISKRQSTSPSFVTSIRALMRAHNELLIAKVQVLNKKEIIETYGMEAYSRTTTELFRLLNRSIALSPYTISELDALHTIDENSYILTLDCNITDYANMLEEIKMRFCSFKVNSILVPVSIGMSVVSYPLVSELSKILEQLDIGLEYIKAVKDAPNPLHLQSEKGKDALKQYTLSEDLKTVIFENQSEFQIYYQPKVDAVTHKIVGAEGLVRWFSTKRKACIPPNDFIPLSERNGMIKELGRIIFDTIAKDAIEINKLLSHPIRLGVNVSSIQLEDSEFVDYVVAKCESGEVIPEYLDLEVTENVAIYDINSTIRKLKKLQSLGITISLDDFGKGYSSLNYLKNFPIDNLKIDKSFIDTITCETTFCNDIINISKKLSMHTIAEGVETIDQLKLLNEFGCDVIQGYYFYKPVEYSAFEAIIKQENPN